MSFARSLTNSLEEAAVVGGNGVSLKHPDSEESDTGEAGGEANSGRERERDRRTAPRTWT